MIGMSRIEVNLRRLLSQCEHQARENSEQDWRLGKYIGALDDLITDLEKLPNKPTKDTMSDYIRRVTFLKGLVATRKLPTAAEKVVAAQLLSHGSSTPSDVITKEIHQKTTSTYNQELRGQLFKSDSISDDNLRLRKQKSSGEDLDALLKYHHTMQEKIADDMLSLARSLKEQTQLANTIIKKDTEIVEKSSNLADQNFARLKIESEKLEEHSRRAWKCWMWVMIVIVIVIFVNFGRIPKRAGTASTSPKLDGSVFSAL